MILSIALKEFYANLISARFTIGFLLCLFLIPFSVIVIISTQDFIANSWAVREISPDPGGLPARYALKAMIPTGFFLLILQGLSEAFKNLLVIIGIEQKEEC